MNRVKNKNVRKLTEAKNKKIIIMSCIILWGMMISLGMVLSPSSKILLENGVDIKRNEWGDGEKSLYLTAQIGDYEEKLKIVVDERDFTNIELKELYEELKETIPRVILGNNKSLNEIREDMVFPTNLNGYPFTLRWKVSDEDILDYKGKIHRDWNDENEYNINIQCTVILEDFKEIINIPIKIIPKQYSHEEEIAYLLEESLEKAQEATKHKKLMKLPLTVNGEEICWKEQKDMTPIWVLFGSVVTAFATSWGLDYDQKQKEKKKEEQIQLFYPSFVEKFRMFLLAGLSSRNSFMALYEEIKDSKDLKERSLRDCLEKAVNRFSNQVPEEIIYEEFGNECRGPYRKLCYILSVNLRQGNDRILGLLEEESLKAIELRKDIARKKGDEAGVKILFPMILMLMVVMILIMIPAYLNFN